MALRAHDTGNPHSIPTTWVVLKASGERILINVADFDPAIHKPANEPKAIAASPVADDAEDAGDGAEDEGIEEEKPTRRRAKKETTARRKREKLS